MRHEKVRTLRAAKPQKSRTTAAPRASAAGTDTATSSRLSRQAWIDAAVARLAEDSVDALRVDDLASDLGVTKGSFYWHFSGREALVEAVLEWWHELMTGETARILERLPDAPRARLVKLIAIALSPRADVPGGPFELTLRDWARRDAAVMQIVRKVDKAREAIVAELYRGLGFNEAEARDWAHAHMAYVIGDAMTRHACSEAELARRRRIAEALLVPAALRKKPI